MTQTHDADPPGSPTPARPTSGDIARLAGVSVSAVSLAFNERPGLSEATRERIFAVAKELNWRPHRAARALKGAASDVVGLVIARPARTLGVEPFFAHILSGLQARLSNDTIALQLLIVEDTEHEIATYRRWAAENRVDGLVLVDLTVDDERLPIISSLGIPAVMLGGHGELGQVNSVWADDYAAMVTLLEYLSALGHRSVGHVSGTTTFEHTRRRHAAIEDVAGSLDLTVQSVATDFSDSAGAAATRQLLTSRPRPTAVIFDSDVMAVSGLAVATEMGIRVPSDLSIVSFDDSVLTQLTHPSLTALSRDTYALGMLAASELLELIANPTLRRDVKAETPHLVVRGSTAPPSGR